MSTMQSLNTYSVLPCQGTRLSPGTGSEMFKHVEHRKEVSAVNHCQRPDITFIIFLNSVVGVVFILSFFAFFLLLSLQPRADADGVSDKQLNKNRNSKGSHSIFMVGPPLI